MRKYILLFTLFWSICFSGYSATTSRLLVLTEPTAQEHLKNVFPSWLALVRQQTNWSEVVVRTHPRWVGNWVTNDWNLLNKMSNDVVYFNPKAVLIIGRLPYVVGGSWNPDGHENRCYASDVWMGISNFTFSDTVTWPMIGYTPSGFPLNQNIPGDGRPDQITGTKIRWVGRVDFSNLPYMSDAGTWSSGCLNGLEKCPEIDEGVALRSYFTNNIAYRTGRWTTSATGIMSGVLWTYNSGVFGYKYVTNLNSSVTWTGSASHISGGNVRFYYDNWDGTEVEYLYDGTCVPTRGLVNFTYRSYCMEVYRGYNVPFRRLQPGRQAEPYFLVYLWTDSAPFWVSSTSNKYVGDIIDTSTSIYSGAWHLGFNFYGDITLPMVADSALNNSMTVNELKIN